MKKIILIGSSIILLTGVLLFANARSNQKQNCCQKGEACCEIKSGCCTK